MATMVMTTVRTHMESIMLQLITTMTRMIRMLRRSTTNRFGHLLTVGPRLLSLSPLRIFIVLPSELHPSLLKSKMLRSLVFLASNRFSAASKSIFHPALDSNT